MSSFVFKTIRRYGVLGSARLIRDLIGSRLFFSNVRLIRFPWYIRGGSNVNFGKKFTAGVGLRVDAFGEHRGQIVFGDCVQVGDYVHIASVNSVTFGDHVLIASKVYISDHDHGVYSGKSEYLTHPSQIQIGRPLANAPVKIGKNVWIGEGVCILKGVEIGENSIIGASSVVTKSVPADSIAVGNPARVVKQFSHSQLRWVNLRE